MGDLLDTQWTTRKAIELNVIKTENSEDFAQIISLTNDPIYRGIIAKTNDFALLIQLNQKAQEELNAKYVSEFNEDVKTHDSKAKNKYFWLPLGLLASASTLYIRYALKNKYNAYAIRAFFAFASSTTFASYIYLSSQYWNKIHKLIPDRNQYAALDEAVRSK